MKRIITLLPLFIPVIIFGQNEGFNLRYAMQASNANFNNITQIADNYFAANPDNSEGGGYAQYNRWKLFWESRVSKPNESIGSFEYAKSALDLLLTNPICPSSIFSPTWTSLGPKTNMPPSSTPNVGRIISVASDPTNANIVYAGSEVGGLWKTTNGQSLNPTWINITNSLRAPGIGINDIEIDPNNTQIIYVATGYSASGGFGVGILKTIDGGINWEIKNPISPSPSNFTSKIAINPVNSNILYALVNDEVYKTFDGGDNWINVFTLPNSIGQVAYDPNLKARYLNDIEMHPTNPDIIYIASGDHPGAMSGWISSTGVPGGNDGLLMYKTMDGFSSYVPVNIVGTPTSEIPSIRMSLAVSPAEPNSIFAIFRNSSTSLYANDNVEQFYKSTDLGDSWNLVSNPLIAGLNEYYNDLAVSPTDINIIYTVGLSVPYKSVNGGISFLPQNYSQHVDCRVLEIFAGSAVGTNGANDYLIYSNDGGISKTTQGGNPWVTMNGTGLIVTEYYGVGSPVNNYTVAGGTQDNDVSIYDGNSDSWVLPTISQDGGDVLFDKNDPNILYAQKWCCGAGTEKIIKYNFNGTNWIPGADFKPPGDGPNVRAMVMDDNGFLYTGYKDVYKILTPNVTSSGWGKISNFASNFSFGDRDLKAVEVSLSNPNTIYAAFASACWGCSNPSATGVLFKTTTGGGISLGDWVNITANLPPIIPSWIYISDIVTDPLNDQRLWVTMSGFVENNTNPSIYNGEFRVIKSEDGGQTWVDYSEGLTQFPVNDIKYQKGSNDALYIATDVGVFYRDASMSQWECFNSNMPVNIVTDLSISECQNKIWASTYGQGMWESSLVSTTIPVTTSQNSFCSPQSSILSVNLPNPTSTYNWYDAAVGGNFLGSGTSYITPVLSSTTTYYVEETNSFCTSVRTPVEVTVLSPADLYIKDSPVDIGNEPDAETTASFGNVFWNSPDIWIRQTNDGFTNQVSEPIEYTSGVPNYIYVRVKNKGLCQQTADLRVYWAKASTGLSWSSQWVNYVTTYAGCTATLYGDEITPSTNITIPAQSEQIFEIPWEPKNPDDYNCFVDPFHFCLLGRIETSSVAPYGMTFPEGTSVWSNTVDNNNIAWKNVIINNNNPGKFEPFGTTIVRNVEEKANFINLNFISQKDDIGQHLIDFKRIQLYFSVDFIKRWAEGGKRGKDIVMVNDSVVEILSSNATMENIFLRYNEIGAVSLALETKKDPTLSNDKYFNFDIIQYTKGDKIPQGGQTYQIKKGVSRKDCLTPAHEVSKIISGNQVYSDSILISGNIIVPYGATLNFKKATVMLVENASIKVMPGGKLIIDASRLESSCIGKKWAGIEVKGAPAFQNPLIIQNSFIVGSDFPLNLDKTQGILISQSTFLGDNLGTAIVMNKMKDFKIFENTFSNFITGIKTINTSEADVKSIIEKNIFLNVKIALDFTQDKHTKLDIKCNRFSYTDYAILSNQTLLKDQGVLGEGAGNEFISNSTLANNKLKHTNGNSPKYYYDPSQPILSGMNVTTLSSTTDRVCYTYSFDTSSTISLQRLSALSTQEEVAPMQVVSVYSVPNPNTGKATIFYNLGGEKQGNLVIMDIYGKIIGQIKVTSESNKIDVDYREYSPGVYLISLTNFRGEVTNQKMIIAK